MCLPILNYLLINLPPISPFLTFPLKRASRFRPPPASEGGKSPQVQILAFAYGKALENSELGAWPMVWAVGKLSSLFSPSPERREDKPEGDEATKEHSRGRLIRRSKEGL